MKTMKYLGCLLALVFAGASAFAQQNWFTAASAGALVKTDGAWTGDAGYDAGHFKSWETPLKFTATNSKSSSTADATITTTVKFTAMDIEDLPATVESDVKGGLTVVEDATSTPAVTSYYGIVSSMVGNEVVKSWQKLSGVDPDLEKAVEVNVILETVDNVSTIKYVIGETALTCASEFNFNVAAGTTIQSVEYLGECWLTSLTSVFWDNPCTLTLTVPQNAYVYVNGATTPLSGSTVSVPRHGGAYFDLAAMPGYSLTGPVIAPLSNIDDSQAVNLSTSVVVAMIPTAQEAGGDVPTAITVDAMEIEARKASGAHEGTLGYLYTKQDNGQLGWVNYSLGIADNAKIAPTNAVQASENEIAVNFGVEVDPAAAVSYKVGNGDEQETPTIALTEGNNTQIVDVKMILTDEGGTPHEVATVKVGVMDTGKDTSGMGTGTNTFDIVAVPWDAMDGEAVTVATLLNTGALTAGDKLYVWDDGKVSLNPEHYDVYKLNADKVWVPQAYTTRSSATGETETISPAADELTITKGTAVWIERDYASSIIFAGVVKDVTAKLTARVERGGDAEATWSLIANPSVNPFALASILSPAVGDAIVIEDVDAPMEYKYTTDGWKKTVTVIKEETVTRRGVTKITQVKTLEEETAAADTIPAGIGFWYVRAAGAAEMTLTFEDNVVTK